MNRMNDKVEKLRLLAAKRSSGRDQISRDVKFLKSSLRPSNIAQRMAGSVRDSAKETGDKAVAHVRAHPAAAAAVAGTIAAALLYKPLRAIVARMSDDKSDNADYDSREPQSFSDEEE